VFFRESGDELRLASEASVVVEPKHHDAVVREVVDLLGAPRDGDRVDPLVDRFAPVVAAVRIVLSVLEDAIGDPEDHVFALRSEDEGEAGHLFLIHVDFPVEGFSDDAAVPGFPRVVIEDLSTRGEGEGRPAVAREAAIESLELRVRHGRDLWIVSPRPLTLLASPIDGYEPRGCSEGMAKLAIAPHSHVVEGVVERLERVGRKISREREAHAALVFLLDALDALDEHGVYRRRFGLAVHDLEDPAPVVSSGRGGRDFLEVPAFPDLAAGLAGLAVLHVRPSPDGFPFLGGRDPPDHLHVEETGAQKHVERGCALDNPESILVAARGLVRQIAHVRSPCDIRRRTCVYFGTYQYGLFPLLSPFFQTTHGRTLLLCYEERHVEGIFKRLAAIRQIGSFYRKLHGFHEFLAWRFKVL